MFSAKSVGDLLFLEHQIMLNDRLVPFLRTGKPLGAADLRLSGCRCFGLVLPSDTCYVLLHPETGSFYFQEE